MSIKIFVLYANSIHTGSAATNRITHICKALILQGNAIKLYITRPTEKKSDATKSSSGIYEGIDFSYVNKSNIWPESLIKKILRQIEGLVSTSVLLLKSDYDLVLSYADYNFFHNLIYAVIVKLRRKKIVYAVDEYPWSVIFKTHSFFNKLYLKLFYRLFDALIAMTFTLMEYYSSKIRTGALMYHLPMTVDTDRFNLKVNDISRTSNYIAYCGYDLFSCNGSIMSKDGVDILIEAFALVSKKHENISLYIIGESNEYRYKQVEKLNLKEKVIFTGTVDRDDIPRYLCNARLLALTRPNNIQAQGAFPTKLGEYLASGRPVVVSKVGEIPRYLTDNWNAFLVESGDVYSFADKIDYALSNQDISKNIGIRGRLLAENEFDYKKLAIKLDEFLKKV